MSKQTNYEEPNTARKKVSLFLINVNYVQCLLLLCLLYCYPYAEASKLYTDRGLYSAV